MVQAERNWRQVVFMPILFMALMALALFGAVGILLFLASYSERHHRRVNVAANGAPLPAEPAPATVKARGAAAGQ
jgi:hypothetical protein